MKTSLTSVVLAIVLAGPAWSQQARMHDGRPRITVSGEAVVKVKPDKIVISFGIETSDTDITAAKRKNNDILKKTVAAMKECGIPEKGIQTDQLSIEPRWRDHYENRSFIGFFVRNTIVVTISDVETIEAVVTSALEAGVNYIHGLDFQTTELKKHRDQARELALMAAKEKADKMAAVLGQTIDVPVQINESFSGFPWWYWSSWHGWGSGSGRSSGMSQVQVQADRGGSGEIADTVALGELSIRAGVSVTFELKN